MYHKIITDIPPFMCFGTMYFHTVFISMHKYSVFGMQYG